MHPVIWRLAGFVIFMLVSWAVLTLHLLLPWPGLDWAAPELAAMVMVKFTSGIAAGCAFYLGLSWLAKPPEQD